MDIRICLYGRLVTSEINNDSLGETFPVMGGVAASDGMCPGTMDTKMLRAEGVGRQESHGR